MSKRILNPRDESKWGAGIPAAVPDTRGPRVGVVAPLRGRRGANSSLPSVGGRRNRYLPFADIPSGYPLPPLSHDSTQDFQCCRHQTRDQC